VSLKYAVGLSCLSVTRLAQSAKPASAKRRPRAEACLLLFSYKILAPRFGDF